MASNDSDPHQSPTTASDYGASSTTFQPTAKLMDKMSRLAKRRIDPAAIEFPQNAPEFHGGFATVSRALVTEPSHGNAETDPKPTESGNVPNGETPSQKAVAVKRLKVENKADLERVLKLALREARILAELDHENIIKLEGFVEDLSQAKIWLVFPWAENGNLRDFVASEDWEIPERNWLIYDVVRGVEYLHSRDPPICHGDLKSVNILVTSDFSAVITDFGSTRRLTENGRETEARKIDNATQPTLVLEATVCASTNTLTITGNEYTLRWAAPELLNDEKPSLASDVWALGWIFYEVMTNKIPFEDIKKEAAIINNVIRGELPSVTEHARMSLILQLCSVMIKCWSIDPHKRPTAEGCRKSISNMPMIKPDPRLTSASTVSKARSLRLLNKLGYMHLSQHDYVNASKFYTEALAGCTDNSNLTQKAEALRGLAMMNGRQSNYGEAIMLLSNCLQIYIDIGDTDGAAHARFALAESHRLQDHFSEAVPLYTQVLKFRTDTGDRQGRAAALRGLAATHRFQKNYSKALRLYSEAAEISTDLGDRYGRARSISGLANLYRVQKEYAPAITLFSEALQLRTEIGDRSGQANALLGLADTHRDQDHYTDAISLYDQAAEIFQQMGNSRYADVALRSAAHVRQRLERTSAE